MLSNLISRTKNFLIGAGQKHRPIVNRRCQLSIEALEDRTAPAVIFGSQMDEHNYVGDSSMRWYMASNTLYNPLSYSIAGQPPGLSINSSTAR